MAPDDTKERILDAAERLFADHGFAATSLRSITTEAGVNLAAVNYHFGSKDALIEAVFQRRIGPLNRQRLEWLDEIEAAAGDGPLPLEPVVEAFIAPAIRLSRDPERGGFVMRLFGHTFSEPSEQISRMFYGQFQGVAGRFTAALGRALPDLPPEEVFWRLVFMVGAMAHTMALSEKLPRLFGDLCHESDPGTTMERLVSFLVSGMRAPVPATEREGRS